jgi:hypothetical protein
MPDSSKSWTKDESGEEQRWSPVKVFQVPGFIHFTD